MSDVLTDPARPRRWWHGVDRYCWTVLTVAALGWMFDTMDQNLFTLVRVPSIHALAHGSSINEKTIGGLVTAAFLVGWSVGGFFFGILGDRIGRTRTMVATIIIYALFTGLSGLAWSWPSYAVMRGLTGFGVGGEWAAGAAIVAEVFPAHARPMALGTLQALSSIGNMTAAVVVYSLSSVSWRWCYAIGALPALLVFWILRSVKEPEKWHEARAQASTGKQLGAISELFRDPKLRRNTIAALLMAIAGQGALWGLGFWSVDLLLAVLAPYHLAETDASKLKSVMFFIQQIGALIGVYAFAWFSERTNRRIAFFTAFALAWAAVPAFFWGVAKATPHTLGASSSFLATLTFSRHLPPGAQAVVQVAALLALLLGFATMGPFAGYTLYFPELYPTRLRATGCGICYNGGRFLAAIIPILTGALAAHFAKQPGAVGGGFPAAASIVACIYVLGFVGTFIGPETKGRPLPED